MNLIHFEVGDTLFMKKKHPCGGQTFKVLRGGTDVRVICETCSRDLTLSRENLEKMIKKVIPKEKDCNE